MGTCKFHEKWSAEEWGTNAASAASGKRIKNQLKKKMGKPH